MMQGQANEDLQMLILAACCLLSALWLAFREWRSRRS